MSKDAEAMQALKDWVSKNGSIEYTMQFEGARKPDLIAAVASFITGVAAAFGMWYMPALVGYSWSWPGLFTVACIIVGLRVCWWSAAKYQKFFSGHLLFLSRRSKITVNVELFLNEQGNLVYQKQFPDGSKKYRVPQSFQSLLEYNAFDLDKALAYVDSFTDEKDLKLRRVEVSAEKLITKLKGVS